MTIHDVLKRFTLWKYCCCIHLISLVYHPIILVIWEGELLEVRIEHIRSQVVYGCLGSKGSKAPRRQGGISLG